MDTLCGQFYTREGLRQAKKHLKEDGVLAVWSYAQDTPFADALRDVFCEVMKCIRIGYSLHGKVLSRKTFDFFPFLAPFCYHYSITKR